MTSSRVLFWHRRDLRLADNLGLVAAAEISPAVTGVYVLDPQLISPPDHLPPMAQARLWFLTESLVELQQRWRDAASCAGARVSPSRPPLWSSTCSESRPSPQPQPLPRR